MRDCELLQACIFFNDNMPGMPSTANMFKLKYCRGDNTGCARYMIFSSVGRDHVPQDLFPNRDDVAREIISSVVRE